MNCTIKKSVDPRYRSIVEWREVTDDGKPRRRRKHFRTRKEAEQFARAQDRLLRQSAGDAPPTAAEWAALRLARERKIDLLAEIQNAAPQNVTVAEAVASRLAEAGASQISPGSMDNLKRRLALFAASFKSRNISSISPAEVTVWIARFGYKQGTRRGYLSAVSSMYSHARRQRWTTANPIADTVLGQVDRAPCEIITPGQFRELVSVMPKEALPGVAVAAFCGLRGAEIEQLHYENINLARGFVEVTAKAAKTSQRRLVTIPDNLRKWLPSPLPTGPVSPFTAHHLARVRRRKLSYPWPHNALRHSYASYHLALHQDAAKTALALGHATTKVLFAHYRELAFPETARAWFELTPKNLNE